MLMVMDGYVFSDVARLVQLKAEGDRIKRDRKQQAHRKGFSCRKRSNVEL